MGPQEGGGPGVGGKQTAAALGDGQGGSGEYDRLIGQVQNALLGPFPHVAPPPSGHPQAAQRQYEKDCKANAEETGKWVWDSISKFYYNARHRWVECTLPL